MKTSRFILALLLNNAAAVYANESSVQEPITESVEQEAEQAPDIMAIYSYVSSQVKSVKFELIKNKISQFLTTYFESYRTQEVDQSSAETMKTTFKVLVQELDSYLAQHHAKHNSLAPFESNLHAPTFIITILHVLEAAQQCGQQMTTEDQETITRLQGAMQEITVELESLLAN